MLRRLKSDHRDGLDIILRRLLSGLLDWAAFSCSVLLAFELRFDGVLRHNTIARCFLPCSFGRDSSWQLLLDSGSVPITGGILQSMMRFVFWWLVWRDQSQVGSRSWSFSAHRVCRARFMFSIG